MQLLVITLDDMNEFLQTLSALKENGLNGIVLPSTSLKHALLESKVDAAPLFGSLSKIMQRDFEASHTLLMLVREEKIDEIKQKHKRKPISKDGKKFLGLFVFVAIPLPMTGAWTGSCIGSFLDFPVWKASLAVFFGNIVAGLILTTIAFFLPKQYADVFLYGFVILAIAIAVTLYFSRFKRLEKKRKEELEKYANKSEYELAVLKKEADQDGKVLIKKEYVDENGDKHIVIGHDEKRNKSIVDKDDLI